ncbi:NAD(+) diphosphatase [Flammeovirga kamogawensis]|uniref:NAD(+) diphosphatase n=1 Tax=Flammeovirga kamogawensis TaxID=373891 RepID=A0ABX8H3F2_9BACT|nr:NAD(+) diphosphatase [Flammeovirga kamogawensis]MBB6460382.1 NAD+ diphosphatase [Flammeovirga kamogawensis]QWG10189.1 NAD(+) diphosphatase [Flammeovirga kamogawensis]TRX64641.1 NAD(+) diphosphatase [Flammeovirga kamogawensis]
MSFEKRVDLRQDLDFRNEVLKSKQTKVYPIWRNCNLIIEVDGKSKPFEVTLTDKLIENADQIIFLGIRNSINIIGIDFSSLEKDNLKELLPEGEFLNMLEERSLLTISEAPLMAYTRGLMHWNKNSKFCGKCGGLTISEDFGHTRKCSNEACNKIHYPRLEPAIIVLVERINKEGVKECLLGRHVRIPGFWTTLAGFVDFGEQIEEAVSREILEEVGIEVNNIQYIKSQPWPFPSSLMLGFTANATTNNITIDPLELVEADWFTAKELSMGIRDSTIVIPGKASIAYQLISNWIAKEGFDLDYNI